MTHKDLERREILKEYSNEHSKKYGNIIPVKKFWISPNPSLNPTQPNTTFLLTLFFSLRPKSANTSACIWSLMCSQVCMCAHIYSKTCMCIISAYIIVYPLVCALVCALLWALVCAPKLVWALVYALICAPKHVCAYFSLNWPYSYTYLKPV